MLLLYHSPKSRSTRIIALLHAMRVMDKVDIRVVTIPRQDGSGARDPANPHPEGKVPVLVHDGVEIWESAAIILCLTDLFPDAGLGEPAGDPQRGRYLSWLAWYGSVIEPVLVLSYIGVEHPALQATFRGMDQIAARLSAALADDPWLMGSRYTAADLLLASPFHWFPDATPDDPAIKDWVDGAGQRDWQDAALAYDAGLHLA